MVNLERTSLNLPIIIVNNFYNAINCLNINRIVALKVLSATCFRYNSEEITSKFPIPKMKLNRVDVSFPVQVL